MKLGGNITTYTKTASRRQKHFTKIKPRNNVKDLDERYNFNGWNIETFLTVTESDAAADGKLHGWPNTSNLRKLSYSITVITRA